MSNIMNLDGIKNHPSRNGFDLSEKTVFSAKVGELLPVLVKECIPGDKFKIKKQHFTRTMPVNTAAYTRIREYYDYYFVPYHLLWKYFPDYITQMNDTQFATDINGKLQMASRHPWLSKAAILNYLSHGLSDSAGHHEYGTSSNWIDIPSVPPANLSKSLFNIFGFNRFQLSAKLLSYLGYSNRFLKANVPADDNDFSAMLNPFPLLAYQKICQDYFRPSQWQSSEPWRFNVDYLPSASASNPSLEIPVAQLTEGGLNAPYNNSWNMFDLNYCLWNKDYFTGLLPNSQFDSVTVASPLTGDLVGQLTKLNGTGTLVSGEGVKLRSYDNVSNNTAGLSVLALRQAECLQKWKEIAGASDKSYAAQMQAHWGEKVRKVNDHKCQYVDGHASNIDISEVVNNNIADDNAAEIAGKGVGVGDGYVDFEAPEHGIFMCIYHAVPLLDYEDNGITKLCQKVNVTDYAIPELDSIGMQPLFKSELFSYFTTLGDEFDDTILGYAPRYIDYKTSYDRVLGAFQSSLSSWVAPINLEFLQVIDGDKDVRNTFRYATFLFVNPAVLNSIFVNAADASVDTDQLLVNCDFDFKAVRNLSVSGMPY